LFYQMYTLVLDHLKSKQRLQEMIDRGWPEIAKML
jgi:1,2-phenylacetyl-CoA epoxidase catalytic subunit